KVLGAGVLFSASIEFLQLFIARATDVDDILLNVAGVMLGYVGYKVLAAILPATGRLAVAGGRKV
ncbi:MAG: VanZ family protein, partial [Oscillospiraceae bacterium]